MRTLYAFDASRPQDLTFTPDVILLAHPPLSSENADWYFAHAADGSGQGWVPQSYVEEVHAVKARAVYPYDGGAPDELPFVEGDVLDVVDQSDADWWKVEKEGVVFRVPGSYLEIEGELCVLLHPLPVFRPLPSTP